MTRYCLTRAEPSTLEAAFALALREDYTVASSYARALTPDARASAPEPMEIDAIEAESRSRSTSTDVVQGSTTTTARATVVHWSATAVASLAIGHQLQSWQALKSSARPTTRSRPLFQKTVGTSRCGAPYWLERRSWCPGGNRTS
ncbi:hypothetical protein PF007_g32664 [Phytophthora fragariae]|nr:hypothetical protein PF007_g32664 [Phytophthora fragariae]